MRRHVWFRSSAWGFPADRDGSKADLLPPTSREHRVHIHVNIALPSDDLRHPFVVATVPLARVNMIVNSIAKENPCPPVADRRRTTASRSRANVAFGPTARSWILTRGMIVARVRAGLTQEQVAQRLGTHKSAISRLENGLTRPTLSTIENYALVGGCDVEVRLVGRSLLANE